MLHILGESVAICLPYCRGAKYKHKTACAEIRRRFMVYIDIIRTPLCFGDLFGLAAFFALHIALGTVDHNGQAQYNQ